MRSLASKASPSSFLSSWSRWILCIALGWLAIASTRLSVGGLFLSRCSLSLLFGHGGVSGEVLLGARFRYWRSASFWRSRSSHIRLESTAGTRTLGWQQDLAHGALQPTLLLCTSVGVGSIERTDGLVVNGSRVRRDNVVTVLCGSPPANRLGGTVAAAGRCSVA